MSQNNGKNAAHEQVSIPELPNARSLVECSCVQMEPDLRDFLLGVLKDRNLVDDAFQRTFVRAIEAAESVNVRTVRGWLFRIALNEARQILRDVRKEVAGRDRFTFFSGHSVAGNQGSSESQSSVEMGLVAEDVARAIQQSMAKLPSEQREVIRRRMYEDQTFAEISRAMGLPLGTVLTWMRRGLLRLREDSRLRSLTEEGGGTSS